MIFSVRQFYEKYRKQHQPLYLAFTDLTTAFDLVSRDGLFKIVKIRQSPSQFSIHNWDNIQCCVLAPTLFVIFGIFFSTLLSHAFKSSTDVVYLHILVMMASCSTWTDSEPSPKPPVSSSEICCSQLMTLLQFTLWWSSAPHKQLLQSLWWLRSHNQHYKHRGQGAGHLIFTLHLSQWHTLAVVDKVKSLALTSQTTFHLILRSMPALARPQLWCQSWQK